MFMNFLVNWKLTMSDFWEMVIKKQEGWKGKITFFDKIISDDFEYLPARPKKLPVFWEVHREYGLKKVFFLKTKGALEFWKSSNLIHFSSSWWIFFGVRLRTHHYFQIIFSIKMMLSNTFVLLTSDENTFSSDDWKIIIIPF